MTDAKRFREAGQAMFGRSWVADMADLLGIGQRTSERLASGSKDVPGGMWPEIAQAAETRSTALKTIADAIRTDKAPHSATGD